MKLLGLSGSTRAASSNTALLRALGEHMPGGTDYSVLNALALPVFNVDHEGAATPDVVLRFCEQVSASSGLIISSPEYVRSIPGGLKNAIDWLVSREEIVHKPIALVHASHRGDDMLDSLRVVLATVSTGFSPTPFLRIPLMGRTPEDIVSLLSGADTARQMALFIEQFVANIRHQNG